MLICGPKLTFVEFFFARSSVLNSTFCITLFILEEEVAHTSYLGGTFCVLSLKLIFLGKELMVASELKF